jgi:hypothetical protein
MKTYEGKACFMFAYYLQHLLSYSNYRLVATNVLANLM